MRPYPGALLAIVVGAGILFAGAAKANADCYSWAEARSIIAQNGLVPVRTIRHQVLRRGGKLVRANLCKQNGRFVYMLGIISPRGQVKDVIVDAFAGRRLTPPVNAGKPLLADPIRPPKLRRPKIRPLPFPRKPRSRWFRFRRGR